MLLQTRYQAERQPRLVSGSVLSERAWRLAVDLEKGGRPNPVRRVRLRAAHGAVATEPGAANTGTLLSLLLQASRPGVVTVVHVTGYRTDGFAGRLYEAEYDLPGTASIRPLYGQGVRAYALLTARLGPASLSFRYRWQRDTVTRRYLGGQVDLTGGR